MREFKVGDKVRVINIDMCEGLIGQINKVFTITSIEERRIYINHTTPGGYFPRRFELVSLPYKSKRRIK